MNGSNCCRTLARSRVARNFFGSPNPSRTNESPVHCRQAFDISGRSTTDSTTALRSAPLRPGPLPGARADAGVALAVMTSLALGHVPVSARSMSEAICGDSARTRRCAKVGAPRRACKPRRGACLVKRTHFLGDGRQCRTGFFCTPSFPTPVCGRFSSRSTKPRRNDAARRAVRIAARRCTARPTRASRTVWRLSSERMPGGAACVVATVGVG